MNTLVIVLIAAVCLFCGYTFYGRWLANKWGIDPKAKTPAVDFRGWTGLCADRRLDCISHISFPPSQAQALSPVPFRQLHSAGFRCLLWVILGGIFFGAVTDFGALYASVKNEGKSMGLLIEKYIGKTGRKLFLLFCWLFTLIVIAAFADMVAGTFNAYTVSRWRCTSLLAERAQVNGAAGSISLLFMVFAMVFRTVIQKHLQSDRLERGSVLGLAMHRCSICNRYEHSRL